MISRSAWIALPLILLSTTVLADPPWQRDGDRHEQGGSSSQRERHGDEDQGKKHRSGKHDRFRHQDRDLVRDYYARNPSNLPPGLAKRNGSLPPGLAKRQGDLPPGLSRGQVLTSEHEALLLPLPPDLAKLLPPPPHEVIQRILGRDILMIDKINHRVLDVLKDALP